MRAGDLRHYIEIQVSSGQPDSFGQPIRSWSTVYSTWAKIEPKSGREFLQAQTIGAEVSHTITIRYSGYAILPTYRVKWGNRVFSIHAVRNLGEKNRQIEIDATEVM